MCAQSGQLLLEPLVPAVREPSLVVCRMAAAGSPGCPSCFRRTRRVPYISSCRGGERSRRTKRSFFPWACTLLLVGTAWFKLFILSSLMNKLAAHVSGRGARKLAGSHQARTRQSLPPLRAAGTARSGPACSSGCNSTRMRLRPGLRLTAPPPAPLETEPVVLGRRQPGPEIHLPLQRRAARGLLAGGAGVLLDGDAAHAGLLAADHRLPHAHVRQAF
jgi:hypothetical protein